MSDRVALQFTGHRLKRGESYPRPHGPFAVEADGITVRLPVADRMAPTAIVWALIDVQDYAVAMRRRWRIESHGYVAATGYEGRGITYLHSEVLPPRAGVMVDHIRGEKLDCRRQSLRYLTPAENGANRLDRGRAGLSSRFRGVTWHKQRGRWQAAAFHMGRCIYGGLYDSEELAAAARDRLAAKLWPGIVPPNLPNHEDPIVKTTVQFQLEQTTKHTARFAEIDEQGERVDQANAVIGSLQIRKTALNGAEPRRLTITVESEAA